MVVGFTTTYAISAYHQYSCELEPRWWGGVLDTTLCDKVDSDLWQVSEFVLVLRFPPPIKLTANDITEILLKVALNTISLNLYHNLRAVLVRFVCSNKFQVGNV